MHVWELHEILSESLLVLSRKNSRITDRLEEQQLVNLIQDATRAFEEDPTLLQLTGRFVVVGDIHGSLSDLIRILQNHEYPDQTSYLFLGDYVDRGPNSIEVVVLLYTLKLLFPKNVFMLRGNHEDRSNTRNFGFRSQCLDFLSRRTYHLFVKSFSVLPLAATINGQIFCIHGGISPYLTKLKQISKIKRPLQVKGNPLALDLLWSDPSPDISGFKTSPRGYGHLYGSDALSQFLEDNDLTTMIRAHEFMSTGFDWPYDDEQCLTIFSSCDYCALKNKASIAIVDLDGKIAIEVFSSYTPEMLSYRRVILPGFLLSRKATLASIQINDEPNNDDIFQLELPNLILA